MTRWSPRLALLWSVAMAAAAVAWAVDALPHPFGDAEAVGVGALFNGADPWVGTTFVLLVGLVGTACASVILRRPSDGSAVGRAAVVVAAGLAVVAGLVLVDGRLLSVLGYLPVVAVQGWWEPDLVTAFVDGVRQPFVPFLLGGAVGCLVWGATFLTQRRRRQQACVRCGRTGCQTVEEEVALRDRALRIGRIAVRVAVVSALVYPAMRLPWALGVPIGLDAAAWAEMQRTGADTTGIILGLAGVGGAVLTTGLVRNWGVRYPAWMFWVRGRRVPIALAVVPASVVAIAMTSLGRGVLTSLFVDGGPFGGAAAVIDDWTWVHVLGLSAMLPWGLALAVATAAYVVRRRGACATCGQGLPEELPRPPRRRDPGSRPADRSVVDHGTDGDGRTEHARPTSTDPVAR